MTAYRKIWKTRDLEEWFDLPEALLRQQEVEVIILPTTEEETTREEDTVYLKKIIKEDASLLQRLSE